MNDELNCEQVVEKLRELLGQEASVVVSGRDRGGNGVSAELTGRLREVGPDP
jgi:hypothetical protein